MTLNMYSVAQSRIWTERVNKEDITRLLWNQRTKQGDIMGDSKRFEVFKNRLERNTIEPLDITHLPPIDKKKVCKRSSQSIQESLDKSSLDRTDALLSKSKSFQAFDMYPVSAPVREKLYDGFSKQGKGRYQYLKDRKQLIPENKFQFPLCSSWDYGWRLEDAIPKESIKNPTHGRRAIVENDFFTRNEIPQYHKDRHAKEDDARAYILIANK